MRKRSSLIGNLAVLWIVFLQFNGLAQESTRPVTAGDSKTALAQERSSVPDQTPALEIPLQHNSEKGLAPAGNYVSPWLLDVIKLAEARIDESVMRNFIESAGSFNLNPDQIIYLQKLGVSAEITKAMLEHDSNLTSGLSLAPAAPSSSPSTLHLNFTSEPSSAGKVSPTTQTAPAAASSPSLEPSVPTISETSTQAKAAERDDIEPASSQVALEQAASPDELPLVTPVRKPYPVQLLDPIIMIRAEGRTPNLLVIELP